MNVFKRARLKAGMTQKELARKVGVSNVAVSRWETGTGLPKVGRLEEVAEALNTTVEKLLDDHDGGT